ncbi:MAG: Fe-S cluster assembly protein IscX [Zoogloeaceae bacterium]|jgi:FeS assembly protein IscX|nr:Fe-S cluster assembly protein IscX [Zoogloeaceae bacterium]
MTQWNDIHAIARALAAAYPQQDPSRINFVDLRNWILSLPDFNDDPARCGEKILEAIQQAWMEEW